MSDIVLFIDWLYCIDLFGCRAASLFNKLTYLLNRSDAVATAAVATYRYNGSVYGLL